MSDIIDSLRKAECIELGIAEITRLRAENEKLREQYDAGVAAWNPVYEIVLNERDALKAENEKLRAERDLWISRFEDFRKNAARLEEARSRPMRLVGSAAAAALNDKKNDNK